MTMPSRVLPDAPASAETLGDEELYAVAEHSPWRAAQRVLRADRAALGGLILLGLFVVIAAAAPFIAPHDPLAINLSDKLQGPSARYPLGTDQLGRDLASRLIYGARATLGSAIPTTIGLLLFGLVIGISAGFLGGWVDRVVVGSVDVLLALPRLILSLALVGFLGPSLQSLLIAIIAVGWADHARIFRAATLAAREWEFVLAARALGASDLRIMARHILPNIIGPIVVLATLDLGHIILMISSLSFLGLGIQPPAPEWGAMLNDARTYLDQAPHLVLLPGLCILLTVLACNLLGDGLRAALDPRSRQR